MTKTVEEKRAANRAKAKRFREANPGYYEVISVSGGHSHARQPLDPHPGRPSGHSLHFCRMTTPIEGAADWLRLSHTKRWGICQTVTTQSVAEHSWRVWCLVHVWGPQVPLTPEEQAAAEAYALVHDVTELRTGDMPTTLKTPEYKTMMAELEDQILPEIAQTAARLSPQAAALVKFCDTAEAVLYLRVHGQGTHTLSVQKLLEDQLLAHHGKTGLPDHLHSLFTNAYHLT